MLELKIAFIRQLSAKVNKRTLADSQNAVQDQQKIFKKLIKSAKNTQFGHDHQFDNILNHADFQKYVPVRDYEALKQYIDQIINGKRHVLWKGKPKYFAKTSGTTSGVKYIPITKKSMPSHINTATRATLNYVFRNRRFDLFSGKIIFLSGSPVLDKKGGILTGRLSGIVNHEVPSWLRSNQLPSYETNCIEDWETKLDKIVEETKNEDLRVISGIPPWVQMYFERLLAATGKKTIKEIFPNFQLFIHGGVNYEPYRKSLESMMGGNVDTLETFPASEGFIAYQSDESEGLLLNTNAGMFFEFIPLSDYHNAVKKRLTLAEVQLNVDYALVITSDAGLWAYDIGDLVRFVSLDPFKIVVSGRVKHFISAFGEHVIGSEVEQAMQIATKKYNLSITEFTVAPMIEVGDGQLPYHQWLVETDDADLDINELEETLDHQLRKLNIYYDDLRSGNILSRLKITILPKDSFVNYMKSIGKLGGQNKVPRLSNNRELAEAVLSLV
ncbi:MAG: GH3 auxin-responsive promoter family protein [Lewinellaceae bacterium]|nr:GH3 auxin-responsive promoter family protein [Lewinellaceae bacterium]